MRRTLITAFLIVLVATVLGATVFREEVAAAAANLNVFVTNDAAHPVPVRQQGTLTVDAAYETQLLIDQVVSNNDRITIPVAAYKTLHVDFDLVSGNCALSGARLFIVETTHFLNREQIGADESCQGGFSGKQLELPGRELTFIASIPSTGDTWRVVVFGRAN